MRWTRRAASTARQASAGDSSGQSEGRRSPWLNLAEVSGAVQAIRIAGSQAIGGESITVVAGDPEPGMALPTAVDWIVAVLLGPTATGVAVIAVGYLGFLMLSGRLPIRRAGSVIIGCFILLSAEQIASGLLAVTSDGAEPPPPLVAPTPLYTPAMPRPEPYDPHAGAAVPEPGDRNFRN